MRLIQSRLALALLCVASTTGISCLAAPGLPYLGCLLLIGWAIVFSRLSERQADRVWACLVWVSVGASVWALIQAPWIARPTGPFGSPNYLGAFCAVMLFVALSRAMDKAVAARMPRVGAWCAVGTIPPAVALTQSRGAILAVAAGLVALLGRRRPVLSGAIICAATLLCIFGQSLMQRGPEARLEIWRTGLGIALHRPLTGWGLGGVSPVLVADGRLVMLDHFYSVPLDWLVATGFLGLAAAIWVAAETWVATGDGHGYGPPGGTADRTATCHSSRRSRSAFRSTLTAWLVAGLFLSASWPMWLVLMTLLGELERRNVAHRAAVIEHHQPLLDSGVGPLRTE